MELPAPQQNRSTQINFLKQDITSKDMDMWFHSLKDLHNFLNNVKVELRWKPTRMKLPSPDV